MPKTNWGNKRLYIRKSQNDATNKQTGYLKNSNKATTILIAFSLNCFQIGFLQVSKKGAFQNLVGEGLSQYMGRVGRASKKISR